MAAAHFAHDNLTDIVAGIAASAAFLQLASGSVANLDEIEWSRSAIQTKTRHENGWVLYQPLYPVTAFAQERLVIDAMFSGIRISLFQASQHASMMAS